VATALRQVTIETAEFPFDERVSPGLFAQVPALSCTLIYRWRLIESGPVGAGRKGPRLDGDGVAAKSSDTATFTSCSQSMGAYFMKAGMTHITFF
jgi:hypothetical protein